MQRYFINGDQLLEDYAIITGENVHHISAVMRANVDDKMILCVHGGNSYLAQIVEINKTEVKAKIVEQKKENVELPVFVTIAQGITKGDKFDWVLQKATEGGASGFIPVAMKRSVAKIDAKKADKKVERWQKIVLEAARQSHRQKVPDVGMPVDMSGLIATMMAYDVCMFAYEAHDMDSKHALADMIASFDAGMRVLLLVGPEGGFDMSEVEALTEAGFIAVGLGPRILRTETAPIYVMSAISYAMEVCRS